MTAPGPVSTVNDANWHKLAGVLAALIACLWAATSVAQGRYALVIGNADYSIDTVHTADLATPVENARFMSEALTELGWQVHESFQGGETINLSSNRIRQEISDFTRLPLRGSDVLVFFSGHGFSIGNSNYILGTPRGNPDVYTEEWQLEDNGIEVSRIIDALRSANPRRIIVIVDACSDRPPINDAQQMVTTNQEFGFGADEIAVIYSSSPNGVAYESLGKSEGIVASPYSVFTRFFVPRMKMGGSLNEVFQETRFEVIQATRAALQDRAISSGEQEPTYDDSGSISPRFSLGELPKTQENDDGGIRRDFASEWTPNGDNQGFALVIGNGNYSNGRPHDSDLRSPPANAAVVASTLKELGWNIYESARINYSDAPRNGYLKRQGVLDADFDLMANLTAREIVTEVTNFAQRPLRGKDVFFYFSGHGFSHGGENLLVGSPNASIDFYASFGDLRGGSTPLSQILTILKEARPRRIIVVIDACGDQPPVPNSPRMTSPIALVENAGDTEISILFASSVGGIAYESLGQFDESPYSVFTRHFVPNLKSGGTITSVFASVRDIVEKQTQDAGLNNLVLSGIQVPSLFQSTPAEPLPRDNDTDGPNALVTLWRDEPSICASDRDQLAMVLGLRDGGSVEDDQSRAAQSCIVNAALADLGVKEVTLFGSSGAAVRLSVAGAESNFKDGDGVETILVATSERELVETFKVEDVAGFEEFIARHAYVADHNIAFNVFRDGRYRYVIHEF